MVLLASCRCGLYLVSTHEAGRFLVRSLAYAYIVNSRGYVLSTLRGCGWTHHT